MVKININTNTLLALLLTAVFLINGCSRIDTSILGTNAFVNDQAFGTITQQFDEVQETLGINYVRVLYNWNDQVQPNPSSSPNFGFYDEIAASLPSGMDALVILNGLPSWMSNPENWIDDDPRATFVKLWVEPVIKRYQANSRIIGWEIWNEPNQSSNPDNTTLNIVSSPANYVAMLSAAYTTAKSINPDKLVVSAAVTAINEDFPHALNYNKGMAKAGAQQFADRWGVHYYSTEFIHVLVPGGVKDFLNSLTIPIWITESGQKGWDKQLQYAEEVWPFLQKEINNIERLYQYQFTEDTPAETTYGLRNLTAGKEYSDLYDYLKKQAAKN